VSRNPTRPCSVVPGSESEVISTGWPVCTEGKSGWYTSALTQIVLRSVTVKRTSPAFTYCPCVTLRSVTMPLTVE